MKASEQSGLAADMSADLARAAVGSVLLDEALVIHPARPLNPRGFVTLGRLLVRAATAV